MSFPEDFLALQIFCRTHGFIGVNNTLDSKKKAEQSRKEDIRGRIKLTSVFNIPKSGDDHQIMVFIYNMIVDPEPESKYRLVQLIITIGSYHRMYCPRKDICIHLLQMA